MAIARVALLEHLAHSRCRSVMQVRGRAPELHQRGRVETVADSVGGAGGAHIVALEIRKQAGRMADRAAGFRVSKNALAPLGAGRELAIDPMCTGQRFQRLEPRVYGRGDVLGFRTEEDVAEAGANRGFRRAPDARFTPSRFTDPPPPLPTPSATKTVLARWNAQQTAAWDRLPGWLTDWTLVDGLLFNVNFAGTLAKTGAAAVGKGASDVWNLYHYPYSYDSTITNLVYSDNTSSTIGVRVQNAPGEWGNSTGDVLSA